MILTLTLNNTSMKTKKLFLSIFLLSVSLIGFSQETDNQSDNTAKKSPEPVFKPFRIGIYGDAALSWMTPKMDEVTDIKYTSGGLRAVAGWGLFFDLNFTENYTFSSGFRLGGTSGRLTFKDSINIDNLSPTTGTIYRIYSLRYLEIPLDLKLKTNQIGYFTYFFQIGLRPGFRLEAQATDKFDGTSLPNRTLDISGKDQTSFLQLGFNVGVGAEYQISKSFSAFASISYRNGLIDVLRSDNLMNPAINENAYISNVALTTGFIF